MHTKQKKGALAMRHTIRTTIANTNVENRDDRNIINIDERETNGFRSCLENVM